MDEESHYVPTKSASVKGYSVTKHFLLIRLGEDPDYSTTRAVRELLENMGYTNIEMSWTESPSAKNPLTPTTTP